MQLILGSSSPRRAEILGYFSLPFKQASPSFDEEAVPFKGNAKEFVFELSAGKAKSLVSKFSDAVILTADTIVVQDKKLYGKPIDEEDAFRTFKELVGKWHAVYTGVTVMRGSTMYQEVEVTHVLFNQLTDQQIRHYISRIPWKDKAGGYAIQMAGGLIVRKIEGCYYNVMGLPINSVENLLKNFGIELWDYL